MSTLVTAPCIYNFRDTLFISVKSFWNNHNAQLCGLYCRRRVCLCLCGSPLSLIGLPPHHLCSFGSSSTQGSRRICRGLELETVEIIGLNRLGLTITERATKRRQSHFNNALGRVWNLGTTRRESLDCGDNCFGLYIYIYRRTLGHLSVCLIIFSQA